MRYHQIQYLTPQFMPSLNLKPSHKPVKVYYETLQQYERIGVSHEGAVRQAFSDLLKSCCSQFDWTLVTEWQIKRAKQKPLQVDGALVGTDTLPRGYWEARDIIVRLIRQVITISLETVQIVNNLPLEIAD